MSNPSESGGRPLVPTVTQPQGNTTSTSTTSTHHRKRTTSQSSDERIGGTRATASRRRPASKKDIMSGHHAASSRGEASGYQRSTSPALMSPEMHAVNYTRTGRISKAKKGLKVHNCECGRSYTRAEHLRRHQKNHAQDALICEIPECGKTFYRLDLLQRHQERHNEMEKDPRRTSVWSQGSAAEQDVQIVAPMPLSAAHIAESPLAQQTAPYYPTAVSPLPESTNPLRYSQSQFRTPQLPTSAFGSAARSSPNPKSHPNHSKHHSATFGVSRPATISVQVGDGLGIPSYDPYSQSPYSSSSGYASPIPGTSDMTNNIFAAPPYSTRTRTSSNASFIEQPWNYPSRSPTSATSTLAYTWTSNDKNGAPTSLAYMHAASFPLTSAPMTASFDQMAAYAPFGPKSMAQRDEEEQAYLFPDQSYGMGQFASTSPFEQFFDDYWRLFHPSLPLIHRASFDCINGPPMLRAAMLAIGAQCSDDLGAKRRSRILHDRCMKLLDQRDLYIMTEPERLCDYQALFLIEVLSQYRARRAAKTLSSRFEGMYQKFAQEFRIVTARIANIVSSVPLSHETPYELWQEWTKLAGQQRLLLCCYLLEYQQSILLGRTPQASLIQLSGFELPLPEHHSEWDACDPTQWAIAVQHHSHLPSYVLDVTPDMDLGPLDHFQSLLLIAAHYHHFNNPSVYLAPPPLPALDHILDDSALTKHHLLTAKLLQVTPIRALLAVSGESWILSEKVPSPAAFQSCKLTLRTWVQGLWAQTSEQQTQTVVEALNIAIELLKHTILAPIDSPRLGFGADMGVYFAVLVVWAVTTASSTTIQTARGTSQFFQFQSNSPLPPSATSAHFPTLPNHLSIATSQSITPTHPAALGVALGSSHSPLAPSSNSMLQSDITAISIRFLAHASFEIDSIGKVTQWPTDVLQWQQGCSALLRWVKMYLRHGAADEADGLSTSGPTSAGAGHGGHELGELLNGIISVLEKVIGRGWESWGF